MNKKDCLQELAKRIIFNGESKEFAQQCLVISEFTDNPTDFTKISDFLFKSENITHYDLKWEVPLKSVKINLYQGDCFGACLKLKYYETHIIEL